MTKLSSPIKSPNKSRKTNSQSNINEKDDSVSDDYSVGNVGAHDRLFGILDRVATLNRKGMEVLE